jgi:hypothetical protein
MAEPLPEGVIVRNSTTTPQDNGDYEGDLRTAIEEVDAGRNKEAVPEVFLAPYFRDHFTLPTPSSTVRFRSAHSAARVFENRASQFIMEETYEPAADKRVIRVKHVRITTKR